MRVSAVMRLVADAGADPVARVTVINDGDTPIDVRSIHCADAPVRAMASMQTGAYRPHSPVDAVPGRLPLVVAPGTQADIDLPLHEAVPWSTCRGFHLVLGAGPVVWVDRRVVRRFRHEILARQGLNLPKKRRAYARRISAVSS